ncbi:NAD-binding protein [Phellopilus nigrolimitatus]|nr:NAD-binding protein [Phellopilus nigrolimitatus]
MSVTPYKQEALSPTDAEPHLSIPTGRVTAITDASSGIGRAVAVELAEVCASRLRTSTRPPLKDTGAEIAQIAGAQNVLVIPTDAGRLEDLVHFVETVLERRGERGVTATRSVPVDYFACQTDRQAPVALLINNAGICLKSSSWDGLDNWKKVSDVNVFGIASVQQVFVPSTRTKTQLISTDSRITANVPTARRHPSTRSPNSLTMCCAARRIPRISSAELDAHGHDLWWAQGMVLCMLGRERGGYCMLCPDGESRSAYCVLR